MKFRRFRFHSDEYSYRKSVSLFYEYLQIQHHAYQRTSKCQFCYGIVLADKILELNVIEANISIQIIMMKE